MEIVFLLIPLAALLVIAIIVGFFWAVRSGQFDDLEGPAHSILMDDDEEMIPVNKKSSENSDTDRI